MSLSDRSDAGRDPLALDGLIPPDEIPQSSIQKHESFIKSIAMPSRTFDEVDELVEELRKAEFEIRGARP